MYWTIFAVPIMIKWRKRFLLKPKQSIPQKESAKIVKKIVKIMTGKTLLVSTVTHIQVILKGTKYANAVYVIIIKSISCSTKKINENNDMHLYFSIGSM